MCISHLSEIIQTYTPFFGEHYGMSSFRDLQGLGLSVFDAKVALTLYCDQMLDFYLLTEQGLQPYALPSIVPEHSAFVRIVEPSTLHRLVSRAISVDTSTVEIITLEFTFQIIICWQDGQPTHLHADFTDAQDIFPPISIAF